MKLTIYQVDAFSDKLFGGNPAAVCPLVDWLDEEVMKKIANENNLSETAFFVRNGDEFHIRWFTPAFKEVALCGHATLAASHVIFEHLNFDKEEIVFQSASGPLTVKRHENLYNLNFPSDELDEKEITEVFLNGLNLKACEQIMKGKDDYLVIVKNQKIVTDLKPNMALLSQIEARGIIVSAPGDEVDVVSRCFYPLYGVDEDPVTGSAHTTIIPYWAQKLNKSTLIARQASLRGGELYCQYLEDRVQIGGHAVTYLIGEISI